MDGGTGTTAELLLQKFRGREDVVAIGEGSTFRPYRLGPGKVMKPSWLRKHLSGERCLGFYLMRPDNTVLCSCVDFDNKDESPDPLWRDKTETFYYGLCRLGIQPAVELSQSGKASHVWVFFSEPVLAYLVRRFWAVVSESLEVAICEIYPRQDSLKDDSSLGNLVRYPLWGSSCFVDIENDWEALPVEEALSVEELERFSLVEVTSRLGGDTREPHSAVNGLSSRVEQLLLREHTLLSRRWHGDMDGLRDASRSALVQSIACELVRLYVPTPEIERAVREWCDINGYEKGSRGDWVKQTCQKAYEFAVQRTEKKSESATTLKEACKKYLERLATGDPEYIPTGVSELDASIDGLGFGEVCVVAAQTGHGKSAFALQWIHSAAASGKSCLIVSEEMSDLELGKRALCSIGRGIDQSRWGDHLDVLRDRVELEYSRRSPIYIVQNVNTIDRCEEVVDQFTTLHGVSLVAVDYLQLLGGRSSNRYEVVTDVSRRLKQAARRNDVGMIVLSQMNREIDRRDGRQPKLSDLRESGQIEQDADMIIFLQWPSKFDSNEDSERYLIYVGKRRNGPIRSTKLEIEFDANHQEIGPIRHSEFDAWNVS